MQKDSKNIIPFGRKERIRTYWKKLRGTGKIVFTYISNPSKYGEIRRNLCIDKQTFSSFFTYTIFSMYFWVHKGGFMSWFVFSPSFSLDMIQTTLDLNCFWSFLFFSLVIPRTPSFSNHFNSFVFFNLFSRDWLFECLNFLFNRPLPNIQLIFLMLAEHVLRSAREPHVATGTSPQRSPLFIITWHWFKIRDVLLPEHAPHLSSAQKGLTYRHCACATTRRRTTCGYQIIDQKRGKKI